MTLKRAKKRIVLAEKGEPVLIDSKSELQFPGKLTAVEFIDRSSVEAYPQRRKKRGRAFKARR